MLTTQFSQHRARLSRLLDFAARNVPYYRQHLPASCHHLSDLAQWNHIPLLDKRDIQKDSAAFLSDSSLVDSSQAAVLATSGSSGIPLKIIRPKAELRMQTKRLWRTRAEWFSDVMQSRLLSLRSLMESPNQAALHLCSSTKLLDLTFDAIEKYAEAIDDYRPDWMEGTPSAVYRFAEFYRWMDRTPPSLKFIEVSGEELLPYHRSIIEAVFGCPVVNQYGCREFWILSYECPSRSMHAWSDDLMIEVLDGERSVAPGETGEIVVTSLTNYLMPLIRYRLGDYVEMIPSCCSCGNSRPILNPIGGRTGSLIVTRSHIYRTAFLNELFSSFILEHDDLLRAYQVVQTDYDRLEIRIIPGAKLTNKLQRIEVSQKIAKGISRFLPEVRCEFKFCTDIPLLPSGKMPLFVSKIKI